MSRLTIVLSLFCVFALVLPASAQSNTPTQETTSTRATSDTPTPTSTTTPLLISTSTLTASPAPTATPITNLPICPTNVPVNGASVFSQNATPVVQSSAQNCVPATGTPYWIAPPTPATATGPLFAQDITLAALGISDLTLFDPQGSAQFRFTLPDNWQMQGSSYLHLNVRFFQDSLHVGPGTTVPNRGNIYIYLDNLPLTLITLNSDSQAMQDVEVPLPLDLLQNPDHQHTLRVNLDTLENCLNNINARLFINSAQSFIHFEYQQFPPLLDLGSYPHPFYNHELPTTVPELYMVLPDDATTGDWEAAASLSAGLGSLTNSHLKLHAVQQSELTPQQRHDNNLILIGRPEDNSLTAALYNAQLLTTQWSATSGLSLDGKAIAPTDGVVQLIAHPENDIRAILVITGETDEAIKKAAQSLADPKQRLGQSGALALVTQINPPTVTEANIPTTTSFTFADLGYTAEQLHVKGRGTSYVDINFPLPAGFTTTDSAFLELHYSFADTLANSNSIVSMWMNDTPLDSFYMNTDNNGQQTSASQHVLRAAIPKDSLLPGEINDISIQIDIEGQWGCYPPSDASLWFGIDPSSFVSLPLGSSSDGQQSRLISQFPSLFNQQIDLHNLWFSLPAHPSAAEFQQFINYAEKLGSATTRGQVFAPHVSLGDFPVGTDTKLYDFIVWGIPSTNSFLNMLNPHLPQPFAPGTDAIQQVINSVVYQLPPQFNLGILQMLPSPWNADNTILVITGTSAQGELEAGQTLLDNKIDRAKLEGNVVFSRSGAITTINTLAQQARESAVMTALPRLSTAQAAATASPVPAVTATPSATLPPSETPDQSLSPTPVSTIIGVAALPTSFPTFEPLSSADIQPPAVKRPGWATMLLAATVVTVGIAALYILIRLIRSRRSSAL